MNQECSRIVQCVCVCVMDVGRLGCGIVQNILGRLGYGIVLLHAIFWILYSIFYIHFHTLYSRSDPFYRYGFGLPKFFSKTFKFCIISYSTWQISRGGQCRKACRSREKESKQSEITCKQSEPVKSISKIEKRKEFVRALWYEQCPKNSLKRLYNVKGLLVLVEKASFSKEFRLECHSGWEGHQTLWRPNHRRNHNLPLWPR